VALPCQARPWLFSILPCIWIFVLKESAKRKLHYVRLFKKIYLLLKKVKILEISVFIDQEDLNLKTLSQQKLFY
jgi:hypothetical protein